MTTFVGKDGVIKAGGTAVAEVRGFAINQQGKIVDDTVMGDTWETHQATFKAWNGSANVLWDDTDSGQTALAVGASVSMSVQPEGDTTGDKTYTGTATITAVDITAQHDGLVEAAITFVGNGALTEGTA